MRPPLRAVTALAILLVLSWPAPAALGHAAASAPTLAPPQGPGSGAGAPGVPSPPAREALWGVNTTVAPALLPVPAASSPSISDISPAPLPPIPTTTPVVMTFATASKNCCVSANFSAPSGTWALILLNYTGEAVQGVYDSSFRAYIDQAQVFFGTTPEYGIWYDDADMTPYSGLLVGTFNFTFLLGAAVTTGYFLTSVSLLFYPVPAGAHAPTEPDLVVPLWHRVFTSTTSTFVWDVATIPQNVTNATLQLWAYGFGPDEFWYAEQPGLRTLEVSVDNSSALAFLPMEYINTGGNDLFAWRPITAAFTENDRPYDLDVTALLGTLEGTHNFTATMTGVTSGSNWLIGGSLLLYTNASEPAASPSVRSFVASAPHVVTGVHSYAEFANTSSEAQSLFGTGSSATNVTLFENTTYQNVELTPTGWENISMVERIAQTVITVANGTRQTVETNWTFPFSADLGSVFVPNSGQGTGYPIYGNVTEYMLNLRQQWNETGATWTVGAAGPALTASYSVLYDVTGGNNVFSGTEELISANAAQILSITFVESATSAEYRADRLSGGLVWQYDHVVLGSGYNPPAPDQAETILLNEVVAPVNAGLSSSAPEVDVGGTLVLEAHAVGGAGNYQYVWAGLPTGCRSNDSATLRCQPTGAGTFVVGVAATDSAGATSLTASTTVLVAPAPQVTVSGNGTQVDPNVAATFRAAITGGVAPYVCTWQVPGFPTGSSDCSSTFTASGTTAGTAVAGTLEVTDGTGRTVNTTFSFDVVAPPALSLVNAIPSHVTAPTTITLRAVADGGVGPYEYIWLVNSTIVQNSSAANFTFGILGAGTYTVLVEVTDADGAQAAVGPQEISATGSTAQPPGAGGTGSSNDVLEWALIAGIVAGAAGVLAGVLA